MCLLGSYLLPPLPPKKEWRLKSGFKLSCQAMLFSIIKTRLVCKIRVLYLQNQGGYGNFVRQGDVKSQFLKTLKSWNPAQIFRYQSECDPKYTK